MSGFVNFLQNTHGKKWLVLYFALFLVSAIIETVIISLEPYWGEMNLSVSAALGFKFNLVIMVIMLLCLPLIYSIALIFYYIKRTVKFNEIKPSKVHVFVPFILLNLITASGLIFAYFFQGQVKLFPQKLEFYSIIFYPILVGLLIILIYPVCRAIQRLKSHIFKKIGASTRNWNIFLVILSASYIFAFIIPILFVPSNVLLGELPPKPDIIAHRGACHLAPENTIIAGELAVENEAVGWEVDIVFSRDGIPFLMHDATLIRTTNVKSVYPDRKNDPAETFKWSELKKLDAGSWFVDLDPYGAISEGLVSQEQAKDYKGERIPSFEEVLNFTRDHDLILDFDLKTPSEDHPYYDTYFDIILNMTIDSGIDLKKIMIPAFREDWMDAIEEMNATKIFTGDEYTNTGDGYTNEEYRKFYEDNFPVMVYTIDSLERFSQLWCLGVTWVKTNEPNLFKNLKRPLLYENFLIYITIWLVLHSIAIITVLIIRNRLTKEKIVKQING